MVEHPNTSDKPLESNAIFPKDLLSKHKRLAVFLNDLFTFHEDGSVEEKMENGGQNKVKDDYS